MQYEIPTIYVICEIMTRLFYLKYILQIFRFLTSYPFTNTYQIKKYVGANLQYVIHNSLEKV